jgi:hypothetical protein
MYTFAFRSSPDDLYQESGLFDTFEKAEEVRKDLQTSQWSVDVSHVYEVDDDYFAL